MMKLFPKHLQDMERILPDATAQGVIEQLGTVYPAKGTPIARVALFRAPAVSYQSTPLICCTPVSDFIARMQLQILPHLLIAVLFIGADILSEPRWRLDEVIPYKSLLILFMLRSYISCILVLTQDARGIIHAQL